MVKRTEHVDRKQALPQSREEAAALIADALYTTPDEPEPFVRLLLLLYDREKDPDLREAIHRFMKAAYDSSIVHSFDFDRYLDAIRNGWDPLKEARPRGRQRKEADRKRLRAIDPTSSAGRRHIRA